MLLDMFHQSAKHLIQRIPRLRWINCHHLSYASRGNFKDGVRYGKYGPVGSDKKTEEEKVHSSKHFLNFKRQRLVVTTIYWSVLPIIMIFVLLLNWYKETKAFKSDSVLS